MHKQLLASLAPLLAMIAAFAMPSTAQAEPPRHWYSEGKLIVGQAVPVATSGTLTFDLTQFGVTVTCKVKDSDTITNPPSGAPGTDEMTAFTLSGCKVPKGTVSICKTKIEVIAHGLPWLTHLTSEPPATIRDAIEGIALEFRCKKGTVFGTVTGTLSPKVGNSVLEFEGGAVLSGPFGVVTVTGIDKLKGPIGDRKITAA